MTFTKEEARIKIQKLVEDFRAHEATLEKAAEAQIENNFIRPLFRYLNWNTENQGLSHSHYEFKVQVTNKKGLRPDYILNLGGRDVLVMDAKQVKYSMKDPRWLYQVYSYAYSTQNSKPSEKIDFAILTDFQEFIVLDCTLFAAKPEAVNNFRVLDWSYNDYIEKFDELWELLERNNVLNDSLPHVVARSGATKQSPTDEEIASGKNTPALAGGARESALATTSRGLWSRYLSPQKVKANRISPDKAFLAEMDDEKSGWRVLLAKDMKKRNFSADGELITAAVQLLIDRLIFIKALSDREVDKDYLAELAKVVEENGLADNDTGWFKACKTIFDELNNFYNGSIFQERRELENITVSNRVVRSVITDLQPENSPYNFAVLPVEILGTIYERFLGRVVRTTEKQVKIEDKPEVRKAGGVYYTPQYIVDYIVENTLGSLLKECKSPADAAKLKILDPACGSGSFLLGAYSKLINWHKDYFARVEQVANLRHKYRESFYKDESGQIRLTAKLKREILKNNLFGVDIDPQAVEVTRFSLSLKALEDLREGELTEERSLFHQTVLPDLSANIKNGNSLIGSDYFAGKMFSDTEEMKRVNAFNWKSEFKEIIENGGFDGIIGNPPYIRIQTMKEWAPLEVEIYKEIYQSAKAGNYDIYVVFVEKALSLLNERGRMGYILPSKFFATDYGEGLRNVITTKEALYKIVDFGHLQVFEQATTYTCLLFLAGSSRKEFEYVKISTPQELESPQTTTITNSQVAKTPWMFADDSSKALSEKLLANSKPLGDLPARIGRGSSSGSDEIFILTKRNDGFYTRQEEKVEIESEILRIPIYATDFGRYEFRPEAEEYIIFPYEVNDDDYKLIRENELKSKYPKAFKYLTGRKKELEKRKQFRSWYGFSASRNLDVHETAEILVPLLADKGLFCRLSGKSSSYCLMASGGFSITVSKECGLSPDYVLGLLNSSLLFWRLRSISNVFRGGWITCTKQYVETLPIRLIDFINPAEKTQHDKMVSLVTQMLELHKSKAGAKTQSEQDVYERQIRSVDESIDELVYALYGLSEEEIKIVQS